MGKIDALIFGSMADIGEIVAKDLTAHGRNVVLVDFPQNIFRDFSGYRRELFKAIDRYHPEMVIPVGDQLALAKLSAGLPYGTIAATDSEKNISVLDSKFHTYKLAESLEIPQPRLFTEEDAPEKVIFKRDVSFGGSGVHLPKSRKSLHNLIDHENGTDYLIEEYICGEDISVDCIRFGGYFRAGCYKSISRTYTQGPAVTRMATDCPDAVKFAKIILDSIDYQGVCGMDFRRVADGKLYFLECNARFTGGLDTQIENGFDIPILLYSGFRENSSKADNCQYQDNP